ncbi:peptide/nickel transport system substrate-binding protein [Streptomyces sp. 3211.6]|uniref:ABC transporter substrate-binding protein n=1 Tax=Streptomyces TaxID=1883 RepID=UPI0009A4C358|nr:MULTISPECIES: ABC transporter substrate-binding protein [Streptomyces]RKT03816.1 peptide/nickel transport system substrate-binding protein [Streptomyces sp. 3211.6]RPF39686.1 peptide/nickel transport system substrate-binding protein [Streptomyces sp. Ag109_G2-6]
MNRKTMVLTAAIGLLTPALSACGSASGNGAGSGAIVVGTTDRFEAADYAPAPFDPAYAYDATTWNILRQTVQTLMRTPRGGGQPVPEAASDCRFTDNDNESYRCTLRPGLKFADGDPLTAKDVKFSIDRVRAIKDENGPSSLLSTLDTVEVKGTDTVVFHLKTPDATFPYKLATPAAGIVSEKNYDAKKLRTGFAVDGSGPYTMKPEVKDNHLVRAVFTKNPNYKGDIKLQNDKVELRTFPDSAAATKALSDGSISMVSRTLSPAQITELSAKAPKGVRLVPMPGLEIRYIGFNTDAPAVKDKAVRQALAAAVDRGNVISKVYGKSAQPLYSLVPTTVTGHVNSFFNKYGEANTAKAADLLKAAGIKTPVKLTLNYTTDHYGDGTAAEFQALKTQLNATQLFDITVQGNEWADFRPAQKKGDYAAYGLGWFPDYPDADNFLAPFLEQDNFLGTPYANNTVRTKLIPESRKAADRNVAVPAITEMQDIVADDVPVLPLWQGKQYVAARDGITGVEWSVNAISDLQLWELGRGVSG